MSGIEEVVEGEDRGLEAAEVAMLSSTLGTHNCLPDGWLINWPRSCPGARLGLVAAKSCGRGMVGEESIVLSAGDAGRSNGDDAKEDVVGVSSETP